MHPWPALKIHMHGCLRLRRNTGNISVLNDEGEPMDIITQATCNRCAIVMPVNVLTSVTYTESESNRSNRSTKE